MMIEIDSEVIAEVRNALTIIQLNAEMFCEGLKYAKDRNSSKMIIEQVKRIDSLLPPVKFEG